MTIRVLQGDCRDLLPTLPANSVHCVVCSPPYYALRSYLDADHPDKHREIGSEATPDEYIATMVAVFREVRRVLRDDGTCWLNIGDSFCPENRGENAKPRSDPSYQRYMQGDHMHADLPTDKARLQAIYGMGIKRKDLMMMPARLALALQADGWWIRSEIVWAKPNPMPESVTDRPTSAHEKIYLLTKAAKYFYDADAVREPHENADRVGERRSYKPGSASSMNDGEHQAMTGSFVGLPINPAGRNLRNVWTIATHSFPDAHFATFPTALAARCIKAGTSERGCCAACGKPWQRITEASPDRRVPYATAGTGAKALECRNDGNGLHKVLREDGRGGDLATIQRTTTGWSPACSCGTTETRPAVVCDPFAGAGTTGLVADRLQRNAIMIELSPAYCAMLRNRITNDAPLFAEVTDAPA